MIFAHQHLEQRAAIQGSGPAIIGGDQRVSYADLNSRANRMARSLRRSGVGPATITALYMERSVEATIAIFAILKAGGAYLPIDPDNPAERVKAILRDAAPNVIIAATEGSGVAARPDARSLTWEELNAASEKEDGSDLCVPISSVATAAITYTSGSTGIPKGVIHSQKSLISYMPDFEPTDVCCLSLSLTFSSSFGRLFSPVARGIPVVIVPKKVCEEPAELARAIEREKITTIGLVPSLLRSLLESESAAPRMRTLRCVTVGGAPLTEDVATMFLHVLPEARLFYGYGSSETGGSTLREVHRGVPFASGCVGFPLSHTEIYILNEAMEQVAGGETGELWIGGEHIALGYLGLDDLTASRFFTNRFLPGSTNRLFRTNDLARRRPDGQIELCGRIDNLVKIRGFRVELGEVESALTSHPEVSGAVAGTHLHGGEARLVAYVAGLGGGRPPINSLRAHVASIVPDYMVPAVWIVLPALPLTANGKVDRAALPSPDNVRPELESIYEPPRNELEQVVADIWGNLLGLKPIGVRDSFFDLGGDSIVAVQVTNRLWDLYEFDVPVRAVFEYPTIAEFAAEALAALHDGVSVDVADAFVSAETS